MSSEILYWKSGIYRLLREVGKQYFWCRGFRKKFILVSNQVRNFEIFFPCSITNPQEAQIFFRGCIPMP